MERPTVWAARNQCVRAVFEYAAKAPRDPCVQKKNAGKAGGCPVRQEEKAFFA